METSTCDALAIDRGSCVIDPSLLEGKDYGWSRGNEVHVGAWTLQNDDPTDVIETVAHEYRHQWQNRVIYGSLEHPGGEERRQELIQGDATYAQDIRNGQYASNGRETDAEAFARVVSAAYNEALRG
ncbi:MAG: hypothetical protein ACREP9_23715 [Candidatus Dormibacteraceae bacterium]